MAAVGRWDIGLYSPPPTPKSNALRPGFDKKSNGHTNRRRSLVVFESGTDHDHEVTSFNLADFDRVVQSHRDTGRARVTIFLHDGVAFFRWHVATLSCDRNRGLADLSEQQLVHIVCRETVFGRETLE
jgi:hypothetical protein